MNHQQTRDYLLSRPESWEDFPFVPEVGVYKVKDKMFATLSTSKKELGEKYQGLACMNLKCDPEEAQALRDIFAAVLPGYHMNKKHWNTVVLDGSIPASEIERMIDRSYALVVKGLKKSERTSLELGYGVDVIYR